MHLCNVLAKSKHGAHFHNVKIRIGLAVCRKLIDLMGGDIVLDQEYDSGIAGSPGARFVVFLNRPPLFLDPPMDSPMSTPAAEKVVDETVKSIPDNCSVLCVDDDTVLRRLFSRSVARVKPNWIVQQASNGETALTLASNKHYDIIFMDQYMSSAQKQLLGTETVRALRARGVKSRVCGLSANDMESAFFEAGADAFLLKPLPCEPDALLQALKHVLESDRSESKSAETGCASDSHNIRHLRVMGKVESKTLIESTEDESERVSL